LTISPASRLWVVAGFRIFVTFTFGMLLQAQLREIGISVFWISMLSTVRGGTMTLFSPAWGALSDMRKRRVPVLFITLLALCFLYPLYNFVDQVGGFILVSVLVAMFCGGFEPISMALTADYTQISLKDTARSFSFLNASTSIGMFTGRVVLSVLFIWLSPRNAIWFFAAFAWLPALLSLRIPEGKREVRVHQGGGFLSRFFPLIKDPKPLKQNGLWAIYLSSFLRQMGIAGVQSAIFVYITEDVLLSASLAVILSSINPLLQIPSHLYARKLIARFGSVWSTFIGIFFSAIVPIWFFFAQNAVFVGLAYSFLGLAFGAFFNGASTYITTHSPHHRRAEFLGFLHASRSFGLLIGPLVAGLLSLISFKIMFLTMAMIMLSGALTIWMFVPKDRPVQSR